MSTGYSETMTIEDMVRLMASSASASEWNSNAAQVKSEHGGDYPPTWFETIIRSGLMDATRDHHGW